MTLPLLWMSPVLAFIALLASGRMAALPAALVTLPLAIAVVLAAGPVPFTAADIATTLAGGAWIALPAILVMTAGLFFTEATAGIAKPTEGATAVADTPRRVGTITLFAGPFIETATGFGVGFVVALHALRTLAIPHAPALALAAMTQVLVPWGALGVGTTISSAIVGVPVADVGWRAALIIAPVLFALVVLYWRIARAAGIAIPPAQKLEDLGLMAALAVLLYGANLVLPIELAGFAALGPVLLVRLWRQEGAKLLTGAALRTALPYLALIALLAATRLIEPIAALLSAWALTPGDGAPLFAPLMSPALPLFAVGLAAVAANPNVDLAAAAARTVAKVWRASALTLLLVALAWLLVQSGIAAALARDLERAAGDSAVATVPLLGALGGYLTGSNTGAGALAMPIAGAFAKDEARLAWIAAAAIAAGSLMTALSPVRMVMGQALAAATDRDVCDALRLLIPYAAAGLVVTLAAVAAFPP